MILSGIFDLPWWGYVAVALAFTHLTIAGVTIYLHRHQAHRALDLHPLPSHIFRLWLWMTTGMVTKEWAASHRYHHARCETEDDPHSPQIYGIKRVMWGGVGLYRKAVRNRAVIEKFGIGCPDDWIERNVYTKHSGKGIYLMAIIDIILFGPVAGMLIFGTQMVWIPLFAAGIINGVGHYWGYRNFASEDASTNIFPWGIIIGGEELHNNHHAYATSAKLSNKWYEFDIGWMYIRIMEMLGLAKVKKVAPRVKLGEAKAVCDLETLQAVITHRYDVMANFGRHLKKLCEDEVEKLHVADSQLLQKTRLWITADASTLEDQEKASLAKILDQSNTLSTAYKLKEDLGKIWQRSSASQDQLVSHLNEWCRQAEASGIQALQQFSQRLRRYAS